ELFELTRPARLPFPRARRSAVHRRAAAFEAPDQEETMPVTYFVALPFVGTEEGVAPAQAHECQSYGAALRQAEALSRTPPNVGAIAFSRTGDPDVGQFNDAKIIRTFGMVPERLDEL